MNPPFAHDTTPHADDDAILDLVHDYLDAPSRDRVLAHLASCPACERRLREAVGVHERGRARAAEVLGAAEESAAASIPEIPRLDGGHDRRETGSAWRRAAPVLAAATVLVVAGIAWLRPVSSPRAPLAAGAQHVWLPSDFDRVLRRTDSAPAESLVLAGIAAYDARDLAAAESLLARPLDNMRLEALRRLYLASSRVAQGRPAEAAGLLEVGMMEFVPEPWAGEMQWTLAIVLANTGRAGSSDSIVRHLATRDDSVGARARALSNVARR